ncbi:MAG: hypothetical protein GY711_30705 [bacterium]|nr:hypothetical protein [bacterium]
MGIDEGTAVIIEKSVGTVTGTGEAWFYPAGRITEVAADPGIGFHWPYNLYVPNEVVAPAHLLVLPNNTGRGDDDFTVHERAAWMRTLRDSGLADDLGVPALVPVFPRPSSSWRTYTHALDRDVLTTGDLPLARLELQLLAMVDDARERLAERGIEVGEKILLKGFSANGMFANRMTVLHPERVLVVCAGSPGGWPIAPVAAWDERPLRYPVGVADLAQLTGRAFDADAWARVPQMIFMGNGDDNDSVIYGDGYDEVDKELVFELFGDTPIARWDRALELSRGVGGGTEFRLYEGVGHETSGAMARDVQAFLRAALGR